MDDIKPVYRKSKSALKKLKKWKPFRICKSEEGTQHVFLNFSLRLHQFGSVLCDSDQEFLNFSLSCLEMDAVFKPRNKLVFRTFISQILMEDITQFSLFPKVSKMIEISPANLDDYLAGYISGGGRCPGVEDNNQFKGKSTNFRVLRCQHRSLPHLSPSQSYPPAPGTKLSIDHNK